MVQNEGNSTDGDHLPRLFDRFYRVERSRKQASLPNHGLGLADREGNCPNAWRAAIGNVG